MKNKKIEIRVEKRERITFFRLPDEVRAVCAVCDRETVFVAPEHAAASLSVSMREIFRRIETGAIHFIEAEAGRTLVCPASLENSIVNQSFVVVLDDVCETVQ